MVQDQVWKDAVLIHFWSQTGPSAKGAVTRRHSMANQQPVDTCLQLSQSTQRQTAVLVRPLLCTVFLTEREWCRFSILR